MNTVILSGSPKGNVKSSNSKIFAETFIENMNNPCEIQYIAHSNYKELAKCITNFDAVIFIMPLYIHAMPGIVMKFIEEMQPAETDGKSMGFIVQAGFIETAQHAYVEPYFSELAERLQYTYLGTVSKGEAAGLYMYPKMFKKLLRSISQLGLEYERTGAFDPEIVKKLAEPYVLSKKMLFLLWLVNKLKLDNIGWHKKLRENKALDKRLARPFL